MKNTAVKHLVFPHCSANDAACLSAEKHEGTASDARPKCECLLFSSLLLRKKLLYFFPASTPEPSATLEVASGDSATTALAACGRKGSVLQCRSTAAVVRLLLQPLTPTFKW